MANKAFAKVSGGSHKELKMKEGSATKVGLFILTALLLAVGSLLFVSSVRLFSREIRVVLYFDESVNGLSVGAPIKYRGVPVGRVVDIRTRFNQVEADTAIPVFVDLDIRKLEMRGSEEAERISEGERLGREIWAGLRGRLELESLITGLLYIELDYSAAASSTPKFVQAEWIYPEIPTQPSRLAMLGSGTSELFAQIAAIPVGEIGQRVNRILAQLEGQVGGLDLAGMQAEARGLMRAVNGVFTDPKLTGLLARSDRLLGQLEALGTQGGASLEQIQAGLQEISSQWVPLMGELNGVVSGARELLGPGSAERREFVQSLEALQRLLESLSALIGYLEADPGALLRGRAHETAGR